MKIIINESTDPYFNLAAEEYLLDTEGFERVFMLWRNAPAVIIGRSQNAYAEINLRYTEEHGIRVVRRLTGGGAVFHDLGNLNYTFIVPSDEGEGGIDFARFCAPVIEALKSLGADASLSGRNDIMVSGKKVSGSAQTVRNGRRMHHGCMLYSADLRNVSLALNVNREKLKSKGIASVSSRVDNIQNLAGLDGMDVTDFRDYLCRYIIGNSGEKCDLYVFSDADISAIRKLADSRYSRWEWNFGKSQKLDNSVSRRFGFGTVEISYTLEGGVIRDIAFTGDYFGETPSDVLCNVLTGCRFTREDILAALSGTDVNACISGASPGDIAGLLTQNA